MCMMTLVAVEVLRMVHGTHLFPEIAVAKTVRHEEQGRGGGCAQSRCCAMDRRASSRGRRPCAGASWPNNETGGCVRFVLLRHDLTAREECANNPMHHFTSISTKDNLQYKLLNLFY